MLKTFKNKSLFITGLVIILSTPLFAIFLSPLIAPLFCDQEAYLSTVCTGNALLFYVYPITILIPLLLGAVLLGISVLKNK